MLAIFVIGLIVGVALDNNNAYREEIGALRAVILIFLVFVLLFGVLPDWLGYGQIPRAAGSY